jgi:hypothetical protein
MLLSGLGAEDGADILGNVGFSLVRSAWQLVGPQLGQDLLEGQLDQGVITVGSVRENTCGRGFANLAKADLNAAVSQLGEDLLDGDGDANAPRRWLANLPFEGIGELQNNRTKRDTDGTRRGRRGFGEEFGASGTGGERGRVGMSAS